MKLYKQPFQVTDLFLCDRWENWNLKIPNNLSNITQLRSTKLDSNLGLIQL